MVSWFRFYFESWTAFFSENAPDGHGVATRAHQALLSVEDTEKLDQWFQIYGKVPGVFLVARSKVGRDGKRKIDVLHHLRLIPHHSGEEGEDHMVGILHLGGGNHMSGFLVKDMLADLVPATTGKRSGTRGESGRDPTFYAPSLESLMGDTDAPFGKTFVPKEGEECLTSEDLASRPSIVFVPFYLWAIICKRMSLNDVELAIKKVKRVLEKEALDRGETPAEETRTMETRVGDMILTDQANSPLGLARELARVMSLLEEEEPDTFRMYQGVAQNLLDFLWAANNNLTPGIRLRSLEGNINVMRHTQECLQEFLTYAEDGTLPDWRGDQQADQVPDPGANLLLEEESESATQERATIRDDKPSGLPPRPKKVDLARPPGTPPADMRNLQGEERPAWVQSLVEGLTGSVAEVGVAIREAVQLSRASKEREEDKKKATSKWLPDAMFVIRVLSAENGWSTPGIPELTPFASKLFEMKLLQAIQFVRAKAKDDGWSGCILKSGLSEFMKRGPMAEDVHEAPSGFSVLFFHHSAYSEGDDDSHSMQALREAYGDGEMPDDLVKAFSKLHIFVPTCTFRAGEQIKAAIQFLETICGERTIATGGYRHGLRLLEEHRRLFEREAEKDKMFLFNYLYLLDRMFQKFCSEIKEYNQEQDPVMALQEGLKGERWMPEMINQALEPLLIYGKELGLRPPLKLQERSSLSGLIDMSQVGRGGLGKRPAENQDIGGRAVGGKLARRRFGMGEAFPDWWSELGSDEYIQEWAIPQGKRFGDYFGPHRKENIAGLPLVQHHKSKRPAQICLKYQLGNGGKCKRGADCALAHIRPKDIPSEDFQRITEHLKRVFQTEGGRA